MRAKRTIVVVFTGLIGASAFVGCNSLVGLDQFSITGTQTGGSAGMSTSSTGGTAGTGGGTGGTTQDMDASDADEPFVPECRTNAECTARATTAAQDRYDEAGGPPDGSDAGRPTIVPAMCIQSVGKCGELLSPDCKITVGDYMDDNAVLLGTLFTTSGATAATNLQRQQSATLAFEEINTKGGLPPQKPNGPRRPIVVLSCDETNATRAATHMVEDLHIAALVGPNTSSDSISVSNSISIKGGTLMMTPSAVASSITELGGHLTWLMAPTDVQRSPLMILQINALESQLKTARNKTSIKFGLIFRDDALGQGTQTALLPLNINGKLITDGANTPYVKISGYSPTAATLDTLVAQMATLAPDIIALAGTAEAITKVMNPLEAAWNTEASADRPYYVTIDSAKVPELLTAAANADLRSRVRGTGITPTNQANLVLAAFNIAYANRYGPQPTASSTGPSYDAAYAIVYAIAANKDLPVTGANIATGLRKLAGPAGSPVIEVGSTKITAAFNRLTTPNDAGAGSGVDAITAIGTFNPLEWDDKGAPVNALLEMWCIGAPGGTAAYGSSGLTYDLKMAKLNGAYTQCQ
jgi:ABC-type branched-subunit amino acid transport system substrate-binding protein